MCSLENYIIGKNTKVDDFKCVSKMAKYLDKADFLDVGYILDENTRIQRKAIKRDRRLAELRRYVPRPSHSTGRFTASLYTLMMITRRTLTSNDL